MRNGEEGIEDGTILPEPIPLATESIMALCTFHLLEIFCSVKESELFPGMSAILSKKRWGHHG